MTEDEMLAEIGIDQEEVDEALRRLERAGFLTLELASDGKIIALRRTEKPFCKVEWDDADPRVCQLATELITKVVPMAVKEHHEEIDRILRGMEREGLVTSEQGDGDIIYRPTAKGYCWRLRNKDDDDVNADDWLN